MSWFQTRAQISFHEGTKFALLAEGVQLLEMILQTWFGSSWWMKRHQDSLMVTLSWVWMLLFKNGMSPQEQSFPRETPCTLYSHLFPQRRPMFALWACYSGSGAKERPTGPPTGPPPCQRPICPSHHWLPPTYRLPYGTLLRPFITCRTHRWFHLPAQQRKGICWLSSISSS